MALDASGHVFVVDSGNDRVAVFDPSGAFVTTWGTPGGATGQFATPGGVAVDENGYVYVADQNNNRIQKFSPCP